MIERGWAGNLHVLSAPQMAEYAAAAEQIAERRPHAVLDWGCGVGQVSSLLKARGLNVTSFEYGPTGRQAEANRRRYFPEVEVIYGEDPILLPFADCTFDAVLSMGVLEHVADPRGSLAEIRRVLEPGGTFWVFKLPNRYSYLEAIARRLGLPCHGDQPHDELYTLASARRLLLGCGFEVKTGRYTNLLPLTLPGHLATRFAAVVWRLNRALSALPVLRLLATNVELRCVRSEAPDSHPP